jgi:hypothetical protein
MSKLWFPSLAAALGLLALLAGWQAAAAPLAVEPFDRATWPALQGAMKKPTLVVFSSTSCGNCPAVMEQLSLELRRRKLDASLMAVVTDVAPGEADAQLMAQHHYRVAERLFAFDGQAPALRFAVNPAWRGATPFVALLVPGRGPQWVTGAPSATELDAWARH